MEQELPENVVVIQTEEAGLTDLPMTFKEMSAHVKQLEGTCQEPKVKCTRLETDNSCHVKQKKDMEEQLKKSPLDEDSFTENDDKVLFYTGLTNWKILLI